MMKIQKNKDPFKTGNFLKKIPKNVKILASAITALSILWGGWLAFKSFKNDVLPVSFFPEPLSYAAIVLDHSAGMNDVLFDGRSKYNNAVESIRNFLSNNRLKGQSLSLWKYGEVCDTNGAFQLAKFDLNNNADLLEILKKIEKSPPYGPSALFAAIKATIDEFMSLPKSVFLEEKIPKKIIIITGSCCCNPDAYELQGKIADDYGVQIQLKLVGLGLSDDCSKQLENISKKLGADFSDVYTLSELNAKITNLLTDTMNGFEQQLKSFSNDVKNDTINTIYDDTVNQNDTTDYSDINGSDTLIMADSCLQETVEEKYQDITDDDLYTVDSLPQSVVQTDVMPGNAIVVPDYENVRWISKCKQIKDSVMKCSCLQEVVSRCSQEIKLENSECANLLFERGCAYVELKKITLALQDFKSSLYIDPHNDGTLFNIGKIYHNLRALDSAVFFYSKTLSENESHPTAYYQLGLCFVEMGNDNAAEECLMNFLKINSVDPVAHSKLGDIQYRLKEYSAAAKSYDRALQHGKDSVKLLFSSAKAYHNCGSNSIALKRINDCISINPNFNLAYAIRGEINYSLGNFLLAINDYSIALLYVNKVQQSYLYNRCGLCQSTLGNYRSAINNYNRAIQCSVKLIPALYWNRAICYKNLGVYDSALHDIRVFKDNCNDERIVSSGNLFYIEGQLLNSLKESRKAVDCYSKAINQSSGIAAYFNGRAFAFAAMNDFDSAIKDADSTIILAPRKLKYALCRAEILMMFENYDEAVKELSMLIDLFSNESAKERSVLFYKRGIALYKSNKYIQACSDVDYAIALDNRNYSFYNLRGDCWLSLKKYDIGISDLTHSLALDSTQLLVCDKLANAYRYTNDLISSIKSYTMALKNTTSVNDSVYFLYKRAMAYYENTNIFDAIKDISYSINLSPQCLTYRILRGQWFEKMNRISDALEDYKFCTSRSSSADDTIFLWCKAKLQEEVFRTYNEKLKKPH